MKTAKEYANEYAESRYSRKEHPTADAYSAARNGVLAGVKIVQRWISVKEELPSPNSEFIHTSLFVLVKTDIDFIRTATYNHYKRCFVTEGGKQLDKDLGNVTHWRHIELK
jgi:hypothetical protein